MTTTVDTQGPAPILDPAIAKDLALWLEDMALLAEVKEKLQKLAASIKNHGNVLFEVMQVFGLFQQVQSTKVLALSDVDNLESDLRNKLSAGQSDWNNMEGGGGKMFPPAGNKDASADLVKEIKQIEDFIKYEQGQKTPILDQSSLKNLQTAITSIKTGFGDAWGDPAKMNDKVNSWVWDMHSGQPSPDMKNVQDAFQTLNQSVSEFSATTNSKLQFVENIYKQGLGMYSAAIKNYQKAVSTAIQNSRSN